MNNRQSVLLTHVIQLINENSKVAFLLCRAFPTSDKFNPMSPKKPFILMTMFKKDHL